MRFFFDDDISNVNISTNKLNITPKIVNEIVLYSYEGIYIIKDNKLFILEVEDGFIENMNIHNNDFIIDNSKFNVKETYRYPNKYLEKHIVKEIYQDEYIEFVIEKENNIPIEIYFIIKDKNSHTLNNLATFLSKIK
tara:strand:+ start:9 stop:419 length:411 start_codon:yes stop_codon:yes gene_type:complete